MVAFALRNSPDSALHEAAATVSEVDDDHAVGDAREHGGIGDQPHGGGVDQHDVVACARQCQQLLESC